MSQNNFDETVQRRQNEGAEFSSRIGSEDDSDEEQNIDNSVPGAPPSPPQPPQHHPKVFFCPSDGNVASVYCALLYTKAGRGSEISLSDMTQGSLDMLNRLVNGTGEFRTAMTLTGGGHFAAAIFQ